MTVDHLEGVQAGVAAGGADLGGEGPHQVESDEHGRQSRHSRHNQPDKRPLAQADEQDDADDQQAGHGDHGPQGVHLIRLAGLERGGVVLADAKHGEHLEKRADHQDGPHQNLTCQGCCAQRAYLQYPESGSIRSILSIPQISANSTGNFRFFHKIISAAEFLPERTAPPGLSPLWLSTIGDG